MYSNKSKTIVIGQNMCDNGFIVFKSILFRTHSDASQRRSDRPRGVATRQGGGSIEPIEPPLVTGLVKFVLTN